MLLYKLCTLVCHLKVLLATITPVSMVYVTCYIIMCNLHVPSIVLKARLYNYYVACYMKRDHLGFSAMLSFFLVWMNSSFCVEYNGKGGERTVKVGGLKCL